MIELRTYFKELLQEGYSLDCCLVSHVMLCYTHAEEALMSLEKLSALY